MPGYADKHVNLKYACPEQWLYSRERVQDSKGETSPCAEPLRARTFRTVCRNLVESDSFFRANFSWGDRQILDAATGRGRALGSTSRPVALATSHHLAYLAARTAA
ncbi:hypothetical protein AB0L13_24805 [Saccharopolyspora shandongensis]|uniref:beta family protein n=1 Tax=Saccharopolyspora shandongensis TaxID=418495 RepID=UPI00342C26F1